MKAQVDLTIGAGKVASNLTDFVVRVDLSHMPAPWWSQVATLGGDIRVKSAGVDLPIDLVGPSFDKSAKTGVLWFKTSLTTSAQTFQVECGSGAAAPSVSDPIGRNAVWSDYEIMVDWWELKNRTGKTPDPTLISTSTISGGNLVCDGSVGTGATIASCAASSVHTMSACADRVDTSQRDVMVYSPIGGASSTWSGLLFRGATSYSIWNSTDTFLGSGDTTLTAIRVTSVVNGTTDRKIYTAGVLRATDATIASRSPSGMYFGVQSTGNERWNGTIARSYLRLQAMSADWLAAENESWESPATFYTVGTAGLALGSAAATETDTAYSLTIPVDLGHPTETDTAHALGIQIGLIIGHASETDTAHPLTYVEVDLYYEATIKVGDHEFNLTSSCTIDPDDPIHVLDGLTLGWSIPESSPWPTQPAPVSCTITLWTDDVANLDDVTIGTPISVVLTDIEGNVFGTAHGRVGEMDAIPVRRPSGLYMQYVLPCVDYTVDLAETNVTIPADWPAESADDRFSRIVTLLAAAGVTLVAPADTGSAAFEALAAGTFKASDLLANHLRQTVIVGTYGPQRYIVVPVVVDDVLDRFECVLLDRTVDAALLPGTLDVVDGLLTLTFPDVAADGLVDACDVDLESVSWTRLKFRAVNQVTVAGDSVTAYASRPGPPVGLKLDTTLTDPTTASLMARLYLPDVDENNGWVADAFRLLAHENQATITPSWFPDHRDDPAATAVYVMPIAIVGIPANVNLAGDLAYAGQLSQVQLTIDGRNRKLYVDFALRRQLPLGIGADAASWDWLAATFPTITWDDVDPSMSWYDARLARSH